MGIRRVAITAVAAVLCAGVAAAGFWVTDRASDVTDAAATTPTSTGQGAPPDGAPDASAGSDDERIPVCGVAEGVTFCVYGEAAEAMKVAMDLFDAEGPAAALAYLDKELTAGAPWVEQCHQMIHIIGHQAARDIPMPDVLAVDNRMCQDGYLDGAMEGFADYSTDEEFWEGVRTLCQPLLSDPWKAQSCGHGMGHALAFRGLLDYREAVVHCDLLPEDIRFSCGGGLIMGLTNPVDGSAISVAGVPKYREQGPDVIDETCSDLPLVYAEPCLTILWTLYPPEWDAATLLARLNKVCPVSASPKHCYDGYGSALYKVSLRSIEDRGETPDVVYDNAVGLIGQCKVAGEWEQWCVQGVAYSAAWWWTTLKSTYTGYRTICNDVPTHTREACLGAEREIAKGYAGAGSGTDSPST